MKYRTKLIIVIIIIFLLSFGFTSILTTKRVNFIIEQSTDTNISNVAKSVANDKTIQTWLSKRDDRIADYIETLHYKIEDIEYVVVIDMDSIRYSHPNEDKIGLKFQGGDEYKVLNGESYISYGYGTLGYSKRAFEPIYYNGLQVGAVSVGNLVNTVSNYQNQQLVLFLSIFTIGLGISSVGFWFLSRNIRSSLMGFTPEEITSHYLENEMVLNELNDGILVIKRNLKIAYYNKKAEELLDLNNSIGMNIDVILPKHNLSRVLEEGKEINNRVETLINNQSVITSRFPLYRDDNKIVGAIIIFKSQHEIHELLDEISGYREVSKSLRAQKHEFKNQLHVILGLIKLKEYKLAEEYISNNELQLNSITDKFDKILKDEKISALLVGKVIESSEYNTDIILSKDSYLTEMHLPISSDDLIIVLGNLIENAFDAINSSNKTENRIDLAIIEDELNVKVSIKDTGDGICDSVIDNMFEAGVTTKDPDRGIGLSLVNHVVNKYNGIKSVQTNEKGTRIEIILKKVKENEEGFNS
ncbi:sensor histidine kinase [Mycoplasmatota bacterium]|nr:sensor histidine kinase [Mycoplasmatota bacterium]